MSNSEMKVRTGVIEYLWWRFMPGTTIKVKWPKNEWVIIHDDGNGNKTSALTNDPNDHYRPWLEKNVGRQGIDWNWRIASIEGDTLAIKFRKGKEKWASIITIMWT